MHIIALVIGYIRLYTLWDTQYTCILYMVLYIRHGSYYTKSWLKYTDERLQTPTRWYDGGAL
jgi:hypothetical protein